LQRRPRLAEINGLFQHHLLWSGGLEDDNKIVLELEHFAKGKRDGNDRLLAEVIPGNRLPPG